MITEHMARFLNQDHIKAILDLYGVILDLLASEIRDKFELVASDTIVSCLSISTAASWLTHGFARDYGLPFSNYFAHTSSYWKMPVRATIG